MPKRPERDRELSDEELGDTEDEPAGLPEDDEKDPKKEKPREVKW